MAQPDLEPTETCFTKDIEKIPAEMMKGIDAATRHAVAMIFRRFEMVYRTVAEWMPAQQRMVAICKERCGEQHDGSGAHNARAFDCGLFRIVDMLQHVTVYKQVERR